MSVFSDSMLLRKMAQEPPEFIGVTHNYVSSASSLTLTPHADTQAGDFLIAIVEKVLYQTGTLETGWSRLINDAANRPGYSLYTKVAAASEASNDFGSSGTSGMRGSMITLRNVSRLNLGILTEASGSTTNSTPQPLTLEGGGIVFQSHGYGSGTSISSHPAGMINIGDGGGAAPLHGLYYEEPSVAGVRAGKRLEWNNASALHRSIQFEALP